MRSHKFAMVTTFYPPYQSNELAKRGHQVRMIYSIDAYYLNRRKSPLRDYSNHKGVLLHPLKSKLGVLAPLLWGFVGLSHFISLLERNGLLAIKTKVTLCRYSMLDMAVRVLIKIGFFDPDKARYLFLRHRFLNALRVLSFPIPGFYIIEVICRKGQTKYER